MRRGLRAIRGAFGEAVGAEDLRLYAVDHLRRARARMILFAPLASAYALLAPRPEVVALMVSLLLAEGLQAAYVRRVAHRPIAPRAVGRLRAGSIALGALLGALWSLVVASVWREGPEAAHFLAMVLFVAAVFEAAFQYGPNRLPSLIRIALPAATMAGLFARGIREGGLSDQVLLEILALGVFLYLALMYLLDIGLLRHLQSRAAAALAERGEALERALAALGEKERAMRRLALAAEHASDSIVLFGPDSRIEWVNGGFTARTGWTLEAVAGDARKSLSDPGNDPETRRAIEEAIAAQRPIRTQLRLICRGGRSVWHDVSLTPLFGEDGRLENYIAVEHDIADLKAREAELARKEAELRRLALVAEHAHDAVVIYSPEGRIEWVNPAFTAQTGFAAHEAIGQMAGICVPAGVDEAVFARIWGAIAGRRAIRTELQLRRKDGALYWCEISLSPAFGADGALVHHVSVERDVTEAKAREALLAEKERENRRLALVARHSTDCIVLTDAEGFIEWVNDAFVAQSGLSFEEVRGWAIKRLVAPDCDPDALGMLQAAARAERPHRTHLQMLRQGGSVWHDLSMTPIHGEDGKLRHLISVERDITELKAREALLAEKERENRRLALVARHATDCMLITGLDRRIEWVNQAFLDQMGYDLGEVIGARAAILDAPEADEEAMRALAEAVSMGRAFCSELKVRRSDGSWVWHDVRVTPVRDEEDGAQRYVTVERDITEAKAREAELAAARRAAEAAAEAKSLFLATMSHEIRTPMNGIIGTADLLAESALDEDQRRLLRTIAMSSEALLRIINDLLDLSKLEAGRVEIAPEPFDPADLAAACAQLLRPLAERKGLALEAAVERAPGLEGRLQGDPGRIQQIVLNLLGNAIKFTEGGRVDLRARVEPAPGAQDDGAPMTARLVIEVRDTGIGIEAERLESVFDAFTQADGTITRRFGGTGLGLSISRGLAEAMGGRLTATSEPGRGSLFALALELPLAAPECGSEAVGARAGQGAGPSIGPSAPALGRAVAPGASPPAPALAMGRSGADPAGEGLPSAPEAGAPRPAGALVLLVEDNATNRFLAQRMLDGTGLRILVAEDGAAGVAAFEAHAPDLILMDLSMPVIGGIEATRRIRAIEAARRGGAGAGAGAGAGGEREGVPIVALTANAQAEERARGEAAGVTRFLTKPVRKAALRAAVAAALPGGLMPLAEEGEGRAEAEAPTPVPSPARSSPLSGAVALGG